MPYLFAVLLVIVNSFFAFGKRHLNFFTFLFIFFLWVLYGGNFDNPDYNNYLKTYNDIESSYGFDFNGSSSEYGFIILQKIISLLNVDFNGFLMIISAIGLILIYSTVAKFTQNTNYVFLLYFFMPFFLDVVQVRNFLAMAIMIFSIRYLFIGNKRNNIKFIITILLATTIHYAAFLYLPMVFIGTSSKKKIIKLIAVISILGSVMMLLGSNFMPILGDLIYKTLNTEKTSNWFESKTRYGYLLYFGMQIMNFLMIHIAKKSAYVNQRNKTNLQDTVISKMHQNNSYRFIELVYWINIFAFLFFPFYILASTFTRLMRNLLLLNYIAFSLTSDSFSEGSCRKLWFNFEVIIYVIIWFLIELYIPFEDSILTPILENNLIFN